MVNKSKEFNREIENRIEMEIVVDAYDKSERAIGMVLLSTRQPSHAFQGRVYSTS